MNKPSIIKASTPQFPPKTLTVEQEVSHLAAEKLSLSAWLLSHHLAKEEAGQVRQKLAAIDARLEQLRPKGGIGGGRELKRPLSQKRYQ